MERNSTATTGTADAFITAELLPNDVIMGQYRATRRHPGNARFDQLLHQALLGLPRGDTNPTSSGYQEHAEQIYNCIQGLGGRFLASVASDPSRATTERDATSPPSLDWQVVERSSVIQVIRQVLCENYTARIMASNGRVQEPSSESVLSPPIAPGGWTFCVDVMGNARLTPITSPSPGAAKPSTEYMQPYLELVRLQLERQRLYQYEQELQQFHRQQQLELLNQSTQPEQRTSFSWRQQEQEQNHSTAQINATRVDELSRADPSESDRSESSWTSSHPSGGHNSDFLFPSLPSFLPGPGHSRPDDAAAVSTLTLSTNPSGVSDRERVTYQRATGTSTPIQWHSGWVGALQQLRSSTSVGSPPMLPPPRENERIFFAFEDSSNNNDRGRSSSHDNRGRA